MMPMPLAMRAMESTETSAANHLNLLGLDHMPISPKVFLSSFLLESHSFQWIFWTIPKPSAC